MKKKEATAHQADQKANSCELPPSSSRLHGPSECSLADRLVCKHPIRPLKNGERCRFIGWSAVGSAREILQSTLSSAMPSIETLHAAHVRAPRDIGELGCWPSDLPRPQLLACTAKGTESCISQRQISLRKETKIDHQRPSRTAALHQQPRRRTRVKVNERRAAHCRVSAMPFDKSFRPCLERRPL